MDTQQLTELVIKGIAVAGGLLIGAIAVAVSVPAAMKVKRLKLEIRHKEKLAMLERGGIEHGHRRSGEKIPA